jgi:hypothetical protein
MCIYLLFLWGHYIIHYYTLLITTQSKQVRKKEKKKTTPYPLKKEKKELMFTSFEFNLSVRLNKQVFEEQKPLQLRPCLPELLSWSHQDV